MRLEVINTGTELLLGNTINTHLAFLGEQLLPLGLRITRQLTIPDGEVIGEAVRDTIGRAEIVIVTGGLGPTSDDITRELIAELLGLPLELNIEVEDAIKALLWQRKREINDATRRQAMVPSGARVLMNAYGTAPGLYVPPVPVASAAGAMSPHLILLPGPPRELHPMMRDTVVPLLRGICQGRTLIREMRNFRLANLGESQVAATVEAAIRSLGDIELGYCARAGEVLVRVLGSREQLAASETIISAAFPSHYFSADEKPLEHVVVDLMTRMGLTLATAESCTGGFIAHRLTNVPGSSAVFQRGLVTYANEAKTDLLGVPAELIAAHGAVSEEVCTAMVEGCLHAANTSHALAVTGLAGPGVGTEAKPAGTVYVGLASKGIAQPVVEKFLFKVERETFKQLTSQVALDMLRRRLLRII